MSHSPTPLLTFLSAVALIVLLPACTDKQTVHQSELAPAEFVIPFPDDSRASSTVTPYVQDGRDDIQRSPGAVEAVTALDLSPAPASYEYALYRFAIGSDEPESATVDLQAGANGVWVGVSDYSIGYWRFSGPLTGSPSAAIDRTTDVSPQGSTYIVVVVAGPGATAVIDTVRVFPHEWVNSPNPDSTGDVGLWTSLAVVDGNPAISYFDNINFDLKYVRASNGDGSAWGVPQSPDSVGDVGHYTSLTVVDGNPAISYHDATVFLDGDLKYVRADDAEGNVWGLPQTLDSTGNVGLFTSLEVVNGNPAIGYYDKTNYDPRYIRSTDADGLLWSGPVIPDAAWLAGESTSLAIVNGTPAISYTDLSSNMLKFVRATDVDGSGWDVSQTPDSTEFVGFHTSLAVVNGNPAISYLDNGNTDLKFVRAGNADGSVWDAPLTTDSEVIGAYDGYETSLTVVNGNPAICYTDLTSGDLKYVRASDPDGNAWGTPLTLDSTGNVGQFSSLAVVNGKPAISYRDATNGDLKFIRMQ